MHSDLLYGSKSLAEKWAWIGIFKLVEPHSPWSACSCSCVIVWYSIYCPGNSKQLYSVDINTCKIMLRHRYTTLWLPPAPRLWHDALIDWLTLCRTVLSSAGDILRGFMLYTALQIARLNCIITLKKAVDYVGKWKWKRINYVLNFRLGFMSQKWG